MDAVTLEPLSEAHAARMYQWMTDPAVAENVGLRREPSLERTREWIANTRDNPDVFAFAILAEGAHVGNVVLDQFDTYLGTARLSIYVGPDASRGRGVGRQAVHAALRWGFVEKGLHKIWLTVHAQNAQAIRAYLAAGFAIEGVLRDEFILRGRRLDAFRMSVLKREFSA